MKTPQREMQPAKAKPAPEPRRKGAAVRARAPAEEAFTARELDAARQLIHLSESSASSGTTGARPIAAAAASGGSSPRSVNAPPTPDAVFLGGCADREEEEEREVAGSQRRVKRYRLIAEIYAATEEIGGRSGSGRKNRKD
ncbi:hypothetical protein ZWY2020_036691 [Hordeum vulgare]|nr:hypothetical protein ZWY2020_036691 [Hordeum vulgare]